MAILVELAYSHGRNALMQHKIHPESSSKWLSWYKLIDRA